MTGFRVTKFDPAKRGKGGCFAASEWTSVSDIGKSFAIGVLTPSEYLRIEDAYVETVRRFIASTGAGFLRVCDLELKGDGKRAPHEIMLEASRHVGLVMEGAQLSGRELDWAVRLNLREVVWCRLKGDGGLYVHFGYDYYMYVGSDAAGLVLPSLPEGMHAETMRSPYLADQ